MPTIRPTNPHARTPRREATDAERALRARVRNRQVDGHKIRFQATLGPSVVDFLCAAKGLVIELDGSQHAEEPDRARTAWLEGQGYRVIRFWNTDVLGNLDGVLEAIRLQLAALPGVHDSPSPNPLPQAGEG
ncbi:endonuclease domain-containing protein [uncultured Sphingomonas sp.]|uniref:endonuclease domain-containing protein n=1 Tax=uncultured Sphingomonas sp. TaxID=158754 RepID=UPI0025F2DFC2|nr:endonuclease domain-containing protein [uncultured Sphingomonas sp.]